MPETERRQTPRTTMERLAYINIEPNNGGIVLNVSHQGLCFHSIAPVVRNGKLRFSLLEQNRRMEADGELVWMDDAQKVGGVRFAALPEEAREQIENWIAEPAGPFADDGPAKPSSFPPGAFPAPDERWSAAAPAPALAASAGRVLAATGRRASLGGFSGGLAIGLLVAALVSAGFLFDRHRNQLGQSLIHLGEQLSGKSASQATAAASASQNAPAPASTSPTSNSVTSASSAPAAAQTHDSALQAKTPAPEHRAQPERKAEEEEGASTESLANAPIKVARSQAPSAAKAAAPSLLPPPVGVASGSTSAVSKLIADKVVPLPQFAPAVASNRHLEAAGGATTGPPPKMYFEVGKFKQESWARKATDELAQLGFPTSVRQKGRLWGNAYYVLVGPYNDRDTADRAHRQLASSGFKPRPFERGSRNFTLSSGVVLNHTRMAGDFVIRWESYVPDAKVKFLQDDLLVTSVDARWVERESKNEHNAFVYQRNPDGTHTLLEIRFAGMSKVLVFAGPS
jgi:hypothetical protein